MTIKKTDPRWMGWAINEATDGIEEEPNKDNRGPVIARYIALAKCGSQGDPYCAIAANAALEFCAIPGTRSAAARSFEWNERKNMVRLKGPAYGAITVFSRGNPSKGQGHVGFYVGESPTRIYTLGANQSDDFNVSNFPRKSESFNLVGYFWPASEPLPEIKAIPMSGKGTSSGAGKVT